MIIDTSALLAWLLREPDGERYGRAIARTARPSMSVANWVEAAIVIEGRSDGSARARFDALRDEGLLIVVPLTMEHALEARAAWLRFGRGRHKAALNYGDTMAYATARISGESLLFKGNDFVHTDIAPALRD